MALMLAELYDALREANVSDPSARKAAEAVASYESQLAEIRSDLRVLKWVSTATFGGVAALLLKAYF